MRQSKRRIHPAMPSLLADDRARTPYEKLEDKALLATLQDSFRTLDRREKAVLRSRFGLNGARPKTLEKIGQQLSLTDERVRQIPREGAEETPPQDQQPGETTGRSAAPKNAGGFSACRTMGVPMNIDSLDGLSTRGNPHRPQTFPPVEPFGSLPQGGRATELPTKGSGALDAA